MKFKFNKQALLIIALAIGVCGAITALIAFNVRNQAATSDRLTHSQQEIEQVEQILSLMVDCETGSRGFVITGDEKFLEPYVRAVKNIPARLEQIEKLSKDDSLQQKYAQALISLIHEKIRLSGLTITARRDKGFNVAMQL